MKILTHDIKALFVEALSAAFPEIDAAYLLEHTSVGPTHKAVHGDYSCPTPMQLAKKLNMDPMKIGEAIVENFPKDYRVEKLQVVAPGFVNLRLRVLFLEEELKQVEKGFSVEHMSEANGPVIIDYCSANAAKPMGAHHIITTVLGDSLGNLFDFMGYEVIRINHLGDWGTNFGKIIYAVETWGDENVIHDDPNNQLSKLYVQFNDEAEKNPDIIDEARKIFKDLEGGEELRTAMWRWIISESLNDLERIFKRLGIEFDYILGESFYNTKAAEVLSDGKRLGLFVEGEGGSLIFDMGKGQTPALLQKSDGATLYLTRDLAAVRYRVETWNPASILYVVDHAQSLHFKQVIAVSSALAYSNGSNLEHVSFGRMTFADPKISTRKGTVIQLEEMLDEAVNRAGNLSAEHVEEMPRVEFAALCEVIGVAAVKYAVLNQDRNRDIVFDWDKIVSLDGNSAPYLLYAYARAHQITEKMQDVALSGMPELLDECEMAMLRKMIKFPEILEAALIERKPHSIATYLFELCHEFNSFYAKLSVVNAETEIQKRSRLGIVQAFMHQVKAGLQILGVPVLERM